MERAPKIFAEFKKTDGVTYLRRKTKIIFNGDKNRCIGIVLMLNPGKCSAINENEINNNWKELESKSDKTLDNVADCVIEVDDNKSPQGYVYIVNLLHIKKPNSKKLSEEDFKNYKNKDIINEIKEHINQIKWIWIAFGKHPYNKDKKYKAELKNNVLNQLKGLFEDLIIGESINYTHPYRFCFSSEKEHRQTIINDIKKKLDNS